MLQLLGPEFVPNHNKCLQGKRMQLLADQWVAYPVFAQFGGWFGWFVGGLAGLWVVRGWFDWFVGGSAGFWVVSSFTANDQFIEFSKKLHKLW